MLGALLDDLTALPGLQVTVARDPFQAPLAHPVTPVVPQSGEAVWACWRDAIAAADATWAIAPESGGLLACLNGMVLAAGRRLLGCHPDAVAIAGSKTMTAAALAAAGIAVVPTGWATEPLPPADCGWVAKPDDGVGGEDTVWMEDAGRLQSWLAVGHRRRTHVVQPFVRGQAASLCLLCNGTAASLLSVNSQDVALDRSGCAYRGGVVGGLEDRRRQLDGLVSRLPEAIPGLWGYVGVDVILGAGPAVVVEVNPRLSTSYVGLHRAIGVNPAGLVIDLAAGGGLPSALAVTPVPIRVPVAAAGGRP